MLTDRGNQIKGPGISANQKFLDLFFILFKHAGARIEHIMTGSEISLVALQTMSVVQQSVAHNTK